MCICFLTFFCFSPNDMLYDYTCDLSLHHMRTATQYCCIFLIMVWNLSYVLDLRQITDEYDLNELSYEMD